MNLTELYAQTPVERHKGIIVSDDRVFVKDAEGNVDEYLASGSDPEEQELLLVRSDGDINAIRSKLGIKEIAK